MTMKSDGQEAVDGALLDLLAQLRSMSYAFVTPTPKTHEIVVRSRRGEAARTVSDVLGWSLPYAPGTVDRGLEASLKRADVLVPQGDLVRATIRVSSLDGRLYVHSAFPTVAPDSVFFGPDSYRFASLLRTRLGNDRAGQVIVDVGTGAGIGAIVASDCSPGSTLIATDINPLALRFAKLNARAAEKGIVTYQGDILGGYVGPIDVAAANPPYIVDSERRQYRDGGGLHGAELSLRMTQAILPRLNHGGKFILYTGSAIVAGEDRFRALATAAARTHECTIDYWEIDPDVFGEELESPAYRGVDRIAAVGAVFTRASR
ncbi:MAG: methyltransferase [Sphingomonadaceae bacterium]|nr:methyltransferase [Sphingomonadaceae bacterium]